MCTFKYKSKKVITYYGDFNNGKPEGKGEMSWPDQKRYKGEFFAGKPCGLGSKISVEGKETKGFWVGGHFFTGEPSEGVLEKQMEELKTAQKLYMEQ